MLEMDILDIPSEIENRHYVDLETQKKHGKFRFQPQNIQKLWRQEWPPKIIKVVSSHGFFSKRELKETKFAYPIPITGKPRKIQPRNTGSCDDLIAIRTKLHLTQAAKNRRSLTEGRLTSLNKKCFFRFQQPSQKQVQKRLMFVGFNFCWMWDLCALRSISSIRFGDGFVDFEWFSAAKGFC